MAEGFTAVRAREYHIWQEFVMRLELFDRMTQDERWKKRYEEVAGFIEANHRNLSKYVTCSFLWRKERSFIPYFLWRKERSKETSTY